MDSLFDSHARQSPLPHNPAVAKSRYARFAGPSLRGFTADKMTEPAEESWPFLQIPHYVRNDGKRDVAGVAAVAAGYG
jgi:hypothetical protein